jgi:hypothetical protein
MNDDVKRYIYGAVIVFLAGVLVWVGIVFRQRVRHVAFL